MRRRLLFLCLTVLTVLVLAQFQGETRDANQVGTIASKAAARVIPNRTVPKVDPPRTTLEFPANPTPQDIFRARIFEEPLVPVGAEPAPAENAALAAALLGYSKRTSPDDFSSLTGFLEQHQKSPWRAALLTGLGIEYYNTAHYSLALDAWAEAWSLAKDATDAKGTAIGDRAAGELAYMYARLGRMTELDTLLQSVEGRVFRGPATERISGARAGLSNMKERPEIAFRWSPRAPPHQIVNEPNERWRHCHLQVRLDSKGFFSAASRRTFNKYWAEIPDGLP